MHRKRILWIWYWKSTLRKCFDVGRQCWNKKISLTVVETNIKAINLYKKYGFIEEGVLRNDRLHKDGSYYNTIIMGRFLEEDKK